MDAKLLLPYGALSAGDWGLAAGGWAVHTSLAIWFTGHGTGAQQPEKVETDTQAERWQHMDSHLESFDTARDIMSFGNYSNAVKLLTGNQAKRVP
jgi:hypothetical protein